MSHTCAHSRLYDQITDCPQLNADKWFWLFCFTASIGSSHVVFVPVANLRQIYRNAGHIAGEQHPHTPTHTLWLSCTFNFSSPTRRCRWVFFFILFCFFQPPPPPPPEPQEHDDENFFKFTPYHYFYFFCVDSRAHTHDQFVPIIVVRSFARVSNWVSVEMMWPRQMLRFDFFFSNSRLSSLQRFAFGLIFNLT